MTRTLSDTEVARLDACQLIAAFGRVMGVAGSARFLARLLARPAFLARTGWLMRRLPRSAPHLGHVVVAARKPS
jgi:hypothetical protein